MGAGAGAVVGVGTDAGAGVDTGAGTGAEGTAAVCTGGDAVAGCEDGAVVEFAEPEGCVCLDTEEGGDRLAFPAGGAL